MTYDEVSKKTTPNAIRDATNAELDDRYNHAVSHLLNTEDGVVRQMQTSIRAILDEVARRRSRWAWSLSLVSVMIAFSSTVAAIYFANAAEQDRRQSRHSYAAQQRELQSLSDRLARLETASTAASMTPPPKQP